jgi:hypothetical protein
VQKWHDAGNTGFKDITLRSREGRTEENRSWKGPECKNGTRDQGLREQLRGSKRIKDLGNRRLLYLRKEKGTAIGIKGWSSAHR